MGHSAPGQPHCQGEAWPEDSFQGPFSPFPCEKARAVCRGRMEFGEVNLCSRSTYRELNQRVQFSLRHMHVGPSGIWTLYGPGMFWRHLPCGGAGSWREVLEKWSSSPAPLSTGESGAISLTPLTLRPRAHVSLHLSPVSFAEVILFSTSCFFPPRWVL